MALLYTIEIRSSNPATSPAELVCTYENLAEITYILDAASPHTVFEYRISSAGGSTYSAKLLPFRCEKLVTEFDWGKEYVPPLPKFLV